jgi:hypothetical protein
MSKFLRFLLVGFYSWISAVFFGGVIIDVVYARNLENILRADEKSWLFSEISDLLLLVAFILVITALIAIAVSWQSHSARNILIASLLIFSFELWLPIAVSILKISPDLSWLRLLLDGLASILAWMGLLRFCQSR